MAAISRTLVEGTWLKILRYQCTVAPLPGGLRADTLQPAFLEMLEDVHADRNQQRDVAHLAGPTALEHDAVKINIGVLALDRTIAPGLDRPVDLLF